MAEQTQQQQPNINKHNFSSILFQDYAEEGNSDQESDYNPDDDVNNDTEDDEYCNDEDIDLNPSQNDVFELTEPINVNPLNQPIQPQPNQVKYCSTHFRTHLVKKKNE